MSKKYKDVDIEAVACVHNLQYSTTVQYSTSLLVCLCLVTTSKTNRSNVKKISIALVWQLITAFGSVVMWNSLSSYVVSAESVNCFKNRLDKFWKDQEIIYSFRAEIYGTGNRSEVTV